MNVPARPRTDDDRGSLPLLMLVIIVSTALGGILLQSVLSQNRSTRFDQTRVRALNAAQAGIDVVVGQIRSAGSAGSGDPGSLTCGPWTDYVDGAGPNAQSPRPTYRATIAYYDTYAAIAANLPMTCTSAGPSRDGNRTPRYAVITATGCDGPQGAAGTTTCAAGSADGRSRGRTLQSTYVFRTSDTATPGGQLRSADSTLCMDAGANPAAGGIVTLQTCDTANPPTDRQAWVHRSDQSIELVSSTRTATSLCLGTGPSATPSPTSTSPASTAPTSTVATSTASSSTTPPSTASSSTAPASTAPASSSGTAATSTGIVLEACSIADASMCTAGPDCRPAYDQQWSWHDTAHLREAKTDQSDVGARCLAVDAQTTGAALVLRACAPADQPDLRQGWLAASTVGPGMSGAATRQLVNFSQVATCLSNVGGQLALTTCQQNPVPANLSATQQIQAITTLTDAPTATMLQTVGAGGAAYCLQSTGGTDSHPLLSSCPASGTADYTWTVNQIYTDASKATQLPAARRYTITDSHGLCLSARPGFDPVHGVQSDVLVSTCNGSAGQRWNAAPGFGSAPLANTHELYR